MSTTPTRKMLGRYEVLDTLGQGGMGVVYLANDPVLGRKVAVKTILASNFATEDVDELLRRLLKEGQAAANMRHPGIVTVFDAMQQGDETYIVMEYVAGRKLSDLLKERPNHDTALRILREIAEALDYAHETGIVHRDIKPDNILLDNNDKVRIADFGIAKSLSRHSITPGAVGTPHYMSPEQIRNEDEIDGKADQFSLGVIAYLMLTGRKPFDGKSQLAIGQKIVGEDPVPPSQVDKSLPQDVDAVLLKSLAKDPKRRYATCVAFVEDLERAIRGSSPAGAWRTTRYRVQTGGGMSRGLVAAAVLLVLAAAGSAVWRYRDQVMARIGSKPAYVLRVENGSAGPLQPGHQFTLGDPSAPGDGALSATVTSSRAIPPSAVVELALIENGHVVDRAELHGGTSPLKYAFKAPINQAAYTVRLTVDGVKQKDQQFAFVAPTLPPVPPCGLSVFVMGEVAADGQDFDWPRGRDPSEAADVAALATCAQSVPSTAPVEVILTGNGKVLNRASDAGVRHIFHLVPHIDSYGAELKVNGIHVKTMTFRVLAPSEYSVAVAVKKHPLSDGQTILLGDHDNARLVKGDLSATIRPSPPPSATVKFTWLLHGEPAYSESVHGHGDKPRTYPLNASSGDYIVRAEVDGRRLSDFHFTITPVQPSTGLIAQPPAETNSAPPPSSESGPGLLVQLGIVAGAVALAIVVALMLSVRRKAGAKNNAVVSGRAAPPPSPAPPPGTAGADEENAVLSSATVYEGAFDNTLAKPARQPVAGHKETAPAAQRDASQSPVPGATLTISSCPNQAFNGTAFKIEGGEFRLGRDGSKGLGMTDDRTISHEHALITWTGACFSIRDLGSRFGVFLNGHRLRQMEDVPLLLGAEIRLSQHTRLHFHFEVPELPGFVGQALADRYELKKIIRPGAGSKVVLYDAEEKRQLRTVANVRRTVLAKLLHPALASYAGYLEKFEREGHVADHLFHPNICRILDYGFASLKFGGGDMRELGYICMPKMQANLGDHLDNPTSADPKWVLSWLERVAGALAYAHSQKIYHASLKPSAVVFDEFDIAFVTDFAGAVLASDQMCVHFSLDPDYAAPEQWRRQTVGASTDQYSLAVLAFQSLTGGLPFEGQGDPQQRTRNFEQGPTPADEMARRQGRDRIPGPLARVLEKALSLETDQRYASIAEFSAAFRRAVATGNSAAVGQSVFISYRREANAGWPELIAEKLRSDYGIEAFVDTQKTDGGMRVDDKIGREIRRRGIFVCLIDKGTLESAWVAKEIEIAVKARRRMIPLFYDNFNPSSDIFVPKYVKTLLGIDGVKFLSGNPDVSIADLVRIIRSDKSARKGTASARSKRGARSASA